MGNRFFAGYNCEPSDLILMAEIDYGGKLWETPTTENLGP
jgi:hypothetical protein